MPNTIAVTIIVNLLAEYLPRFGVSLGNDVLTNFVQALIAIGSAVYIYLTHKRVTTAAINAGAKL